jgi:hypothetical protein
MLLSPLLAECIPFTPGCSIVQVSLACEKCCKARRGWAKGVSLRQRTESGLWLAPTPTAVGKAAQLSICNAQTSEDSSLSESTKDNYYTGKHLLFYALELQHKPAVEQLPVAGQSQWSVR